MNVAVFPNYSVYDLLLYFQDMKNAVNVNVLHGTPYYFYHGDFLIMWESSGFASI